MDHDKTYRKIKIASERQIQRTIKIEIHIKRTIHKKRKIKRKMQTNKHIKIESKYRQNYR